MMSDEQMFPNGFTSWKETHYEFIALIEQCRAMDKPPVKIQEINGQQGTGGFWELAGDLTDAFEKQYEDYDFDGEFFDYVEKAFESWLDKND